MIWSSERTIELNSELTDILKNKYPLICPSYFSCDDGWYNIISNVLYVCGDHADRRLKDFKFVQIKEKFGGLRMYAEGADDFINGVVRMAENLSYHTCEITGKEGYLCSNGRLLKTLCAEEAEKLGFEKYKK